MNKPLAYSPALKSKPSRPFAEKAKSHPEYRETIISCLQTFQDEQRDNASLIIEEAAQVAYVRALDDIRKEIAAWSKGEAIKGWSATDTLQALEQFMERMDPTNGVDASQAAPAVEHLRQEAANLAWDQAACCVDHAEDIAQVDCESIRCAMLEDDTLEASLLAEASTEALALALAESLNRATDGELIYAAQALKHGADRAGHWRFIAELSLA